MLETVLKIVALGCAFVAMAGADVAMVVIDGCLMVNICG